VATRSHWPGPRRGKTASGESSVRRPARFSALAGSIATTFVVVELEELVRGTPILVASSEADVVVLGVLDFVTVVLVVVEFEGFATLVDVVVDVVVVAGRRRGVVVVVVVEAVCEAAFERDVVVSGNVVVGCSGREFKVKTRTNNSRGLDHISRCELRRVNRRRAMVIEG
jgi:hypothetical protein